MLVKLLRAKLEQYCVLSCDSNADNTALSAGQLSG